MREKETTGARGVDNLINSRSEKSTQFFGKVFPVAHCYKQVSLKPSQVFEIGMLSGQC